MECRVPLSFCSCLIVFHLFNVVCLIFIFPSIPGRLESTRLLFPNILRQYLLIYGFLDYWMSFTYLKIFFMLDSSNLVLLCLSDLFGDRFSNIIINIWRGVSLRDLVYQNVDFRWLLSLFLIMIIKNLRSFFITTSLTKGCVEYSGRIVTLDSVCFCCVTFL